MTREEYCPTVSAFRTHKVAHQKPVPVTVYDYYDSSRRARAFYEPRTATLCDICEDEDCSKKCSSQRVSSFGNQRGDPISSAPTNFASSLLTVFVSIVISFFAKF